MNVFARELRANCKSTIIWTTSLSTLVVVFLLMFTALSQDVESAQNIFANLPVAIREAFNISLKNFFTIYGFFGYLFTFVSLAGAVQAMNLGVGIISKEVSGKTADFLLTKPVSRTSVITSKLSAAFVMLIFTNLVFTAAAVITANLVSTEDLNYKLFLMISATLPLIQIIFLALGALLAVIIPKVKSVVAVTLPTVFTFFIIGMLGAIIGNDNVRYITPFKFFDANYIINNNAYEIQYVLVGLIFSVIAVAATYIIFIKKDVRSAS